MATKKELPNYMLKCIFKKASFYQLFLPRVIWNISLHSDQLKLQTLVF